MSKVCRNAPVIEGHKNSRKRKQEKLINVARITETCGRNNRRETKICDLTERHTSYGEFDSNRYADHKQPPYKICALRPAICVVAFTDADERDDCHRDELKNEYRAMGPPIQVAA